MKIVQLLNGFSTFLTNEEKIFVKNFYPMKLDSLSEHQQLIAQNLVRKGVYNLDEKTKELQKNYK